MTTQKKKTDVRRARERLKLRAAILTSREKREALQADEQAMKAKLRSM